MIKKALHIILLGWLINALIFFHPVFGNNACVTTPHSEQYITHADNTALDVILNHLIDLKGHKKDSPAKVFIKLRYLSARAVNLIILLPQTILIDFQDKALLVYFSRFKFWEQKSFLPPHHNFLFRLSPF